MHAKKASAFLNLAIHSIVAICIFLPLGHAAYSSESNNYNLVCSYQYGDILINSYQFQVAIALSPDRDQVTHFETLLVEPRQMSEGSYDITIKDSDPNPYVYILNLRRHFAESFDSPIYKIEVFLLNEDHTRTLLLPETTCSINPDFRSVSKFVSMKDLVLRSCAQCI